MQRLGGRAKGAAGHIGRQVRDGLIETAGIGLVTAGLGKARGMMTPKVPTPFAGQRRLATFKKKHLSKKHRNNISAALRGQGKIDHHLRRGETVAKIFRSYAGGVRSLAAAKEYAQKVGRTDSALRRLDRLSTIGGRSGRGLLAIHDRLSRGKK